MSQLMGLYLNQKSNRINLTYLYTRKYLSDKSWNGIHDWERYCMSWNAIYNFWLFTQKNKIRIESG